MKRLWQRLTFAYFCVLHRRSLRAQERWQAARLRALVRHAYAHIPLTRTLLDTHHCLPESVQSLADIRKLPVTDKETFIGKMTEEYIDSSRYVKSRWYVTSGTSGTPFRFLMSEIGVDDTYTDFASFRFLWWRGESIASIASVNIARIKIRAFSGPHRLFVPVNEYLTNPSAVFARLVEFKTEIIYAYPSILLDIAERIRAGSAPKIPRLRFALSFGEMLAPAARQYIESSLECEVYDRYGLEEIGVIGVECAKHDGFHINTESVIVEVLDETGAPVAAGERGRIVATDLYNYGMPFIRYDTGDQGVLSQEPCACGLRSPRLWVTGRYSSFLTFPARRFHHLEFDGAMDGYMNEVLRYQIAKQSDHDILVRIIPGPAFRDGVRESVRKRVQELVGGDIQIAVETVTSLPTTGRGKSRIVVDESAERQGAIIDNS